MIHEATLKRNMILAPVPRHTYINLPIFNAKAFAKHFYSICNKACPLLNTISGSVVIP